MSSPVILGIGLLLLLANLSLCAVFAPTFALGAGSPGARLRRTWQVIFLALIQVAAWAVIFFQGGAAETPLAALEETLGCFALMGGATNGLAGPWSALVPFVALNGVLFIPVSLISGFVPELRIVTLPASGEIPTVNAPPSAPLLRETPVIPRSAVAEEPLPPPLPTPAKAPAQAPAPSVQEPVYVPVAPAPVAVPQSAAPAPASKSSVMIRLGEPFRGSLPPIQLQPQEQVEIELPVFDPERPPERIPPTPPPIRFG